MSPILEELEYSPSCKTCSHWDTADAIVGLCRLASPLFCSGYDYGQWPRTHEADWCGQHNRRL